MRAGNSSASKLLLTVALVMVTAAACGSSSKSAASSTAPTTTAAGAGTATTVAGPPATNAPKPFGGSSGSSFCDLARKDKATFNDNPNIATKTPADLKALYGKLVPALEHARDIAPSAIKGDFATYVTSIKQIQSVLAGAQYNFENLDPTKLQGLNSPALKTAAAHLQQYFAQVCKITLPTTPTT
jgi:hypothetical protein